MEKEYDFDGPDSGRYSEGEVMSIGQWLLMLVIFMIPIVGVVMMFVWAFGNTNQNKKNFCRAYLIYTLIAVVLGGILFASAGAALFL